MKPLARPPIRVALAVMLSALLTACGGGSEPAPADVVEITTMPAEQHNLMTTGRSLDLAMNGPGLFAFVDAQGQPVYSRRAPLDLDAAGHLVHAEGWRLAGRIGDDAPDDRPVALPALPLRMAGQATTRVGLVLNLSSRASPLPAHLAFDPADASTYTVAVSLRVYDPDGAPVPLVLYFRCKALDRWQVQAVAGGTTLPGPVAQLRFDASGAFDPSSHWPALPIPALPDNPWGATRALPAVTLEGAGITQNAGGTWVPEQTVDGYPPGQLVGVDFDVDGHVGARFDNGQVQPAGQLLLARFGLAEPLQRVGHDGLRCASGCSGPIVAPPGQRLLGSVMSGMTEE